jgi:transcriptional regulator with PAS, ATPase and Fis domain
MISLHEIHAIIENPLFILTAILVSFAVKTYLLGLLIPQGLRTTPLNKPWLFLLGTLIGSMFGDLAWIMKLMRQLVFPDVPYAAYIFFVRLSWAFLILQYQSLALFIQSLATKKFRLSLSHKIFSTISCLISCYFLFLAFSNAYVMSKPERDYAFTLSLFDPELTLEIFMIRIIGIYLFTLITLPSLLSAMRTLRQAHVPKILKKQLHIFLLYLVIPYTITEIIQALQLNFRGLLQDNMYSIVGISTILLTYAISYGIKNVIGLRFLNFKNHVQSVYNFDFIDDFKEVLEQLSHATTLTELAQITQHFFKNAFDIPRNKTVLHIRSTNHANQLSSFPEISKIETIVEQFMTTHDDKVCGVISQMKVLIHDEIAFSNFYEQSETRNTILTFLESINADIFIPVFEHNKIIAYIIVERHAREQEFYGNVEHDEMLVFASYLGKSINLLQNRSVDGLIQQEKLLREELHSKHQEIGQYKESMRSFLRNSKQKEIGVIFYKSRRFIFGNKIAKELVNINLNQQEGHPLTKTLRHIAQQVEEYKAPQTALTQDQTENRLVISAVPNLEQNNVIITICRPDISDIITKQIDLLQDPTTWDYLLYLETTESGKLINQFIPGSGELLLNFKIELLQVALTKKAILLEMPEDDLLSTVEILHHINAREQLHVIKLHYPSTNFDLAIKLFGINPMLGVENSVQPLLEKLSSTGTLFIENIHFMNLETQDYLAEFLKTGFYRTFKSDTHASSNVRIICSTNHNLQALVHEGLFSKALLHELKRTSLCMPSLHTLPEEELFALADGFTQQALKINDFKTLFELTPSEKSKLSHQRPVSLNAFKKRVQQMLIDKSKKNHIYQETQFDPAYTVSDPTLIQAARLGKHALRDHKIMTMLWNKFKNQNQIASFLGVNRSSVNRRCKEYNFQ